MHLVVEHVFIDAELSVMVKRRLLRVVTFGTINLQAVAHRWRQVVERLVQGLDIGLTEAGGPH